VLLFPPNEQNEPNEWPLFSPNIPNEPNEPNEGLLFPPNEPIEPNEPNEPNEGLLI